MGDLVGVPPQRSRCGAAHRGMSQLRRFDIVRSPLGSQLPRRSDSGPAAFRHRQIVPRGLDLLLGHRQHAHPQDHARDRRGRHVALAQRVLEHRLRARSRPRMRDLDALVGVELPAREPRAEQRAVGVGFAGLAIEHVDAAHAPVAAVDAVAGPDLERAPRRRIHARVAGLVDHLDLHERRKARGGRVVDVEAHPRSIPAWAAKLR